MSIKKSISLILFLFTFLSVFAANAFGNTDIEKIYRKQCGVCHGDDGDGRGRAGANLTPPASSFIAPQHRKRLSQSYIEKIIREGKAGTAMVAYGKRLDEQQIGNLAGYIRSRFVNPGLSATTPAGSKPQGRDLYVKHCSACHGDNGNTAVWAKNGLNPPPRNFTSQQARQELSLERMISSVTHGRPGTAMMSFKRRLSGAEIESVVRFIRSEFMSMNTDDSNSVTTKIPPISQEAIAQTDFPKGLSGDVVMGRTFYMRNCFTCHGKKGDGKGPRAHFNIPRPRDFTSDETASRFDRAKLFSAIKKGKRGTVMPAWGTVLSDQQIANVAEFVLTEFVQTNQKKKP